MTQKEEQKLVDEITESVSTRYLFEQDTPDTWVKIRNEIITYVDNSLSRIEITGRHYDTGDISVVSKYKKL